MDASLKKGFTLLVFVILSMGCITEQVKSSSMMDTLRAYKKSIRWGEMKDAHNFVRPDLRIPKSQLNDLPEVVSYEAIEGPHIDRENQMSQVVEIEFYEKNNIKLKSYVDNQIWEYDPKLKQWWLISPPVFLK